MVFTVTPVTIIKNILTQLPVFIDNRTMQARVISQITFTEQGFMLWIYRFSLFCFLLQHEDERVKCRIALL